MENSEEHIARTTLLRRAIAAAAGAILIGVASVSLGGDREDIIAAFPMLPPYCKYTGSFYTYVPGGNNRAEMDRYKKLLGGTFYHLHHYCIGLLDVNAAIFSKVSRQDRIHLWGASIGEFDYVIKRAPPDFVLLPEILTKQGESYIRLGQISGAMRPLLRAIELKPDYWPPYAALSDYFKSIGDLPKAREWLDKALAVAPESKALKLRLAELNSTKAKPAPESGRKTAAKADTPPATEQAAAPKAAGKPEPESTVK